MDNPHKALVYVLLNGGVCANVTKVEDPNNNIIKIGTMLNS
jgi:hypothetical protein